MINLTDRIFWENYWLSKKNIFNEITPNYVFSELFNSIVQKNHPQTAIELGGFPGFYSVYLTRYHHLKCYLLDLVIIPEIIHKILNINKLPLDAITTIEGDVFCTEPPFKFDLVYSNGLIEHFDNTESIINQHLKFLNEGGTLLITLPNFRSINGLFQKWFDKKNYDKHYIQCMDLKYLKDICKKLQLKNIKVFYYGHFSIWLEEEAKQNKIAVILRNLLFYPLKAFCKLFRINNKIFSPYIILIATY